MQHECCECVERLRGMMEKDSIRTKEHNILVEENRTLSARLAEVVNIYPEMEQIAEWKATIKRLREHNEKMVRQTNELFDERNATIERLRGSMKWEIAVRGKVLAENEATIASLRGEAANQRHALAYNAKEALEQDKEIERLRGDMKEHHKTSKSIIREHEATIAMLRDGSEYWGMNQELTEQIATLREALEEISRESDEIAGLAGIDKGEQRAWRAMAVIARKALAATEAPQ